ncbi:MAG: MBL fold metallo-hydrolase [Sandaracinaceae bacterium]|nr:MBL fold metallo-hydrolase [Sandaracinaceae bacterium]
MRLHVLGSGTAIPHPERGASGYALVADDGAACLLECGPGSTRRWPSAGIDFGSARVVAVTHFHVDHVCDLAAVLFGRAVIDAEAPLALVGPIGHRGHVAGLRALFTPWLDDPAGLVEVHELADGDSLTLPPFELSARHVVHAEHALGLRVRADGATLAFSGDSGPCDALVELCRGADVALLECSYPSARETRSHLNATTAAEVACAAGVERLVLTHFYPACDGADLEAEVRAAGYRGALHLARDGDRIDVTARA